MSILNRSKLTWAVLIIRLYVGWLWLEAGFQKIHNPKWVGPEAGVAVSGFLQAALKKTLGPHPDVQGWYAWFINHVALPNAEIFSYLVSFGELLVGVALILGAFTVVATSFGLVMNFAYLFAGAVSINPLMILLQWIILWDRKNLQKYGLDKWLLPWFRNTLWKKPKT